jgi:hypothetical protein
MSDLPTVVAENHAVEAAQARRGVVAATSIAMSFVLVF